MANANFASVLQNVEGGVLSGVKKLKKNEKLFCL